MVGLEHNELMDTSLISNHVTIINIMAGVCEVGQGLLVDGLVVADKAGPVAGWRGWDQGPSGPGDNQHGPGKKVMALVITAGGR